MSVSNYFWPLLREAFPLISGGPVRGRISHMLLSMGPSVIFPAVVLFSQCLGPRVAETCQSLSPPSLTGSLDPSRVHNKAARCPLLELGNPPPPLLCPTPDSKGQLICATSISMSWGNSPQPLTETRRHKTGGSVTLSDSPQLSSGHCSPPTWDLCPRTNCLCL